MSTTDDIDVLPLDTTPPTPPPSIRDLLASVVEGQARTQAMVQGLVQLNLATARATFAALEPGQQGKFCRSLRADGVSVEDQADLVGKSVPSVYRYLAKTKS